MGVHGSRSDGEANTGGDGGGTDPESKYAGMGGSGVVIARYPGSVPVLVGGEVSSVAGYHVRTFKSPGEDALAFGNVVVAPEVAVAAASSKVPRLCKKGRVGRCGR